MKKEFRIPKERDSLSNVFTKLFLHLTNKSSAFFSGGPLGDFHENCYMSHLVILVLGHCVNVSVSYVAAVKFIDKL